MKIIENSAQRLVFSVGFLGLYRIECSLDKAADKGTIRHFLLSFPLKTREFPVSDIASVGLSAATKRAGKVGNDESAYPMIVLGSKQKLTLGASTGRDAEAAVALMKTFLAAKG